MLLDDVAQNLLQNTIGTLFASLCRTREAPFIVTLIEREKKRLYLNRVEPLNQPQPELLDWSVNMTCLQTGVCNLASCTKRLAITPRETVFK